MGKKASRIAVSILVAASCGIVSGCADLHWRGVSDHLLTDMGYQKAKNDCMIYKDQAQYRECVGRVERDFGELKRKQEEE